MRIASGCGIAPGTLARCGACRLALRLAEDGEHEAAIAPQPVHPHPRPSRGGLAASGSSPLALTDIGYYQDLAQRAEAALFDSVFFADQLALAEDVAQAPRAWLEPITVLAALAVATSRIGLIATAPPPTPSRSTWRASSPRSTTSATAGSAGTSSPRGSRRRRAITAAPDRSAMPTAMPAAKNS